MKSFLPSCRAFLVLSATLILPPVFAEDALSCQPGPHVTEVCPVGADTLCVVVRHGKVTPGHQEPYKAEPSDQLKPWKYHNWLERNGKAIGTLVGPKKDVIYIPPKFEESQLDEKWASEPSSYKLVCTSHDDPAFEQPQAAAAVHRKARATDIIRTDVHKIESPREHLIYLSWKSPLKPGSTYQLQFANHDPAITAVTYKHDPRQARSESVHVSQLGFRPDDPIKMAFLSLWTGDGGGVKYKPDLPFELIRCSDNKTMMQGKTKLAMSAEQTELPGQVNHNGADVWLMDFSSFSEPGEYRIYVDQVGCSYPFTIGNDVWSNACRTSVRGLLNQRSGIALGKPYTDFTRPRPFHPADGVVIHVSSAAYVESGKPSSPEELFARLAKGDTGKTTANAWGGYMDAGDFDRRAEHLVASRYLFDIAAALPFAKPMNLNIPESSNKIPDIIDEALWGLDCFRRMQQADGSVPGGIESAEHPRYGEASWQESHPIYQYAPDPWATGMYSATAAIASGILKDYDAKLADEYKRTSLLAMDCLEKMNSEKKLDGYDCRVNDARNLAAIQLYILTGDEKWHDVFKQTTAFNEVQGITAKWLKFDQGEAIFAYLLLPESKTDANIRKWGMHAIINESDKLIAAGKETAFGWTGSPAARIAWGRLSSPKHAIALIYAYRLTKDSKYLEAMERSCQFATGANPLNLCFTTGVGKKWPDHVFCGDAIITNQPVPPGLTCQGPLEGMITSSWWLNPYIRIYPAWKNWPACEAYIDAGMYTIMSEPTIHGTMAPTFYMWAHLAARPATGK